MNSLNIVQVLRDYGKPLKDVIIYGKAIHQIRKPSAFSNTVHIPDDCICVKFDVWAVDTTYIKEVLAQMGIVKGTMCFVNASISMFVHKDTVLNDWYSACGTLMLSKRTSAPVLSMTELKKIDDALWSIQPTVLNDFNVNAFKIPVFNEYLQKCMKTDTVQIPDNLLYFERGIEEESILDVNVSDIEPAFDVITKPTVPEIKMTFDDILCTMDSLTEIRKNILGHIKSTYAVNTEIMQSKCDMIISALSSGKKGFAYAPDYIMTTYLQRAGYDTQKEIMSIPLVNYILINLAELKEYLFNGKDLMFGEVLSDLKKHFGDLEYFCFSIYCIILNIDKETTSRIFTECMAHRVSPLQLCLKEPYLLASMNIDITADNLLILLQAVSLPKETEIYRDVFMILDYMSKSGSTCYFKTDLESTKDVGIQVTSKKCITIEECGHTLGNAVVDSLRIYFNSFVGNCLESLNWTSDRNGLYSKSVLSKDSITKAIARGTVMGMLVETKGIVSSPECLQKEVYIYNTLNEIQTMFEAYTNIEDIINKYIAEYEGIKGITLEDNQKKAVHLIKYNVFCITGISGGGKTTVLDCINYVINQIEKNNNDFYTLYTAPTGRASKHISEVLNTKASTIHSTFLNENYIIDADFYAFDESSMITLDMLYEICRRISHRPCKLCFIGDIEQLKPIGRGVPFRDLLNIYPSVKLTVPQRSDGLSSIYINGDKVVNHSDEDNWEDLMEDEHFSVIDCSTNNIPVIVRDIVKYYATGEVSEGIKNKTLSKEGITLDDIQIISPVTKSNYTWSTKNLNNVVHDIFNPNTDRAFSVRYSEKDAGERYRIGDRVVNTKNDKSMHWYKDYTHGHLITDGNNFGVVNGDIGIITDVINVLDTEITDEQGNEVQGNKETEFVAKNKGYFCIVAYTKSGTDEKYYIAYPMEENYNLSSRENKVFYRGKTDYLSLFYAGTVHKLQGSESDVVIAVLNKLPYENGFLSRNMIYTEITRAKKYVYLIGDVKTKASALANARRTKAVNTMTWGSVICKL